MIRYVCLADSCRQGFEKWTHARRHMIDVCHCDKTRIARSESSDKAMVFYATMPDYVDPDLKTRFSGKLKTVNAPSEPELLDFIKRVIQEEPDSPDDRRNTDLVNQRIRSTFGDFPFKTFGFGTFKEFSIRYGLQ